jgi:hypothetical protein
MTRTSLCLAAAALLALLTAACVNPAVTTGAFHNAARIQDLKRGVSTRADVQKLLGVPNGDGGALLPGLAVPRRDIWYYDDIEASAGPTVNGVMQMRLQMQMLAVFFNGDRFDGYLWTTNVPATP